MFSYCNSVQCWNFSLQVCDVCNNGWCELCLIAHQHTHPNTTPVVLEKQKKVKAVCFSEDPDNEVGKQSFQKIAPKRTLLEACLAHPSTFTYLSSIQEITRLLQEEENGKKTQDPNVRSSRGWPLLCEMVASHQVEIVKLLLCAKADARAVTSTREWTCLHVFAKFLPKVSNSSMSSPSKTVTDNDLIAMFSSLVEAKADLNALDRDKESPIDSATQNDRTDVVRLLLTARVDPLQVSTRNGWSLLHQAIFYNSLRCIDFFVFSLFSNLRDELLITCEPLTLQSPLHFAAKANNLDTCKKLLSIAAVANNAQCMDQEGCTSLHLASAAGASFHLLDILKADIQSPDNNGNTPLAVASTVDTVRNLVLLKAPVNHVNKFGCTALSLAVSHGAADVVECLIQLHAHVDIADYQGNTPLHVAAGLFSVNTRRILKCLLDAGCATSSCLNNAGQTALDVAKLKDTSAAVILLLQNASAPHLFKLLLKGDINEAQILVSNDKTLANLRFEGSTALHQACKAKNNAVLGVCMLLQSGADVQVTDVDGCTCLHLAATEGLSELIPLLANTSIKLNALDEQRQTALHKACVAGHKSCVLELLEAKIDVEVQDLNGYSAIELACRSGFGDIVEILCPFTQSSASLLRVASSVCDRRAVALALEHKCEVNMVFEGGNTALFLALQDSDDESDSDAEDEDRIEVVRLLIEAKANVSAINDTNMNVVKYCKSRNHRACRKIIEKALLVNKQTEASFFG